jgi:hypothetical protein
VKTIYKKFLMFFALSTIVIGKAFSQEISPKLIGQNFWLADGDEGRVGYLHKLWDKVEASGVKIVRIGGNGYQNNFPDRHKLNAMVDSVFRIGAVPLIQIPSTYTELQTKELVEYYTHLNAKKIEYWCIGNEPMLHNRHTIEQVHEYVLKIATAFKEVAPIARLYIFDEASFKPVEYSRLAGGDLDLAGKKVNGAWLIDGLTFHNYPNGPDYKRDDVIFYGSDKMRKQIVEMKDVLNKANSKFNRKGNEALTWGLTEFNVTYVNPNREISGFGNPSFLAGQFMAEVFGMGMENEAEFMNPWCISEVDVVKTDFGYIGFPVEFYPRSTYWHMQLISKYFKGSYVATSEKEAYLKTFAAKNEDGLVIMLMNQSDKNDMFISLSGKGNSPKKSKKHKTTVFIDSDGTKISELIDLPSQTTQVYVFTTNGELISKIEYSVNDNLKNEVPRVLK